MDVVRVTGQKRIAEVVQLFFSCKPSQGQGKKNLLVEFFLEVWPFGIFLKKNIHPPIPLYLKKTILP